MGIRDRIFILLVPDFNRPVFRAQVLIEVIPNHGVFAVKNAVTARSDGQRVAEHARDIAWISHHIRPGAAAIKAQIGTKIAIQNLLAAPQPIPKNGRCMAGR